jgi:hypothetical protein
MGHAGISTAMGQFPYKESCQMLKRFRVSELSTAMGQFPYKEPAKCLKDSEFQN